jgi:AcrR family transcriptional regulator
MEKITRKEQKEQTRSRLVQQAEVLFSKQGISATTTAEVAKSNKVSHGALFVHFPTREDLIQAVVERFGDRLGAEMGRRFEEDMSLRDLLKAHLAVLAEFEDFYLRLISESQSLPPKIRSVVYAMNASLSYRFFRAAQRQMRSGHLKKMDQASFFNTWMALLHYHIMNRDLFSERTPILKAMGEDILRHFFHLMKG